MQPPYGREWLSLANLTDADQHFIQWFVLRFRDYSPDAKRVIVEWMGKFDLGAMEHGRLILEKTDVVGELRSELQDATSYLAMIRLQVADIEAAMAKCQTPPSGRDDAKLVARLRAYRSAEWDGEGIAPERLDANDLRG